MTWWKVSVFRGSNASTDGHCSSELLTTAVRDSGGGLLYSIVTRTMPMEGTFSTNPYGLREGEMSSGVRNKILF